MRKDTTFSDRKLSTEEFSRKYWMNGKVPYQYHTASIEDARDEREQFVFNNIRALWNALMRKRSYFSENQIYLERRLEEQEKRIAALERKLEGKFRHYNGSAPFTSESQLQGVANFILANFIKLLLKGQLFSVFYGIM